MLQKVVLAATMCFAFGAEIFGNGEIDQRRALITQRWLLEVSHTRQLDSTSSLREMIVRFRPGGIIYKTVGSLQHISTHRLSLRWPSDASFLTGLDLTQTTVEAFQRLGLTAGWPVLAATGDSALITAAGRLDGDLLMHSGVDFVILDPLALSDESGFATTPEVSKYSAELYISAMKNRGIDVVLAPYSINQWPPGVLLKYFKPWGLKGVNISPLLKATEGIENEHDAAEALNSADLNNVTIFTSWPDTGLQKKKKKRFTSDFVIVPATVPAAELEEALKNPVKIKKGQVIARKGAQWKIDRLLARQQHEIDMGEEQSPDRWFYHNLHLRSSTLLANADSLIPFRELAASTFASTWFGHDDGHEFLDYLNKYARLVKMDKVIDARQLRRISHFDNFVAGVDLAWFSALSQEDQQTLLSFFTSLQENNTRVIVTLFGRGNGLQYFSRFHHVSYHPMGGAYSQKLAAQLLFGAYAYSGQSTNGQLFGKAATTIALGKLQYGDPWMQQLDEEKLAGIDSIAIAAIMGKATPGCQILIARKGMVLYEKSFGHLSYDSAIKVNNETLYDLASLTKVTATLQMVMSLVEQGKIDINGRLGDYLPEIRGTNKEPLLVRDVLLHRAGLKPHVPFWKHISPARPPEQAPLLTNEPEEEYPMVLLPGMHAMPAIKDSVWSWVISSGLLPLRSGSLVHQYRYSDLGFMVLQKLAEKVAGRPLDEFVKTTLYEPLGASRLCFQPLCEFSAEQIAPTEMDYYFRKELVWGTVHDQNAAVMGGVAGHAGLFSNAASLAILLQMHLQKGIYGHKKYYDSTTVELFTNKPDDSSRRALGWDMKDLTFLRTSDSFLGLETTYGHTGFTGTAAWVDPAQELIYIFLSNRVHPDAANTKLIKSKVRTKIQDVIYRSLGWQLASSGNE